MSADDHGSLSTYTNHGCRCPACRAANAAWHAERRRARRSEPIPASVQHGTQSTYTNWSCRCFDCLKAHCESAVARRARNSTT